MESVNHIVENALILHPLVKGDRARLRAPEACLEEVIGLAEAIHVKVVEAQIVSVAMPKPATFIGLGKVEEIAVWLDAQTPRPGLVIFDGVLTPVQHRNLERHWKVKVLDRTALILEIFGARAQTKEGRLQVELAHLTYQRSRLVRSWTHLERQRGGAGFLGGPGERQIESDRRVLAEKIDRLKKQIENVRRTRTLQRAKRKKAPHPVVALVGYTNAGKSTLFNRMTNASVMAADLLFATLDPSMRAVDLPSSLRLIVSDTVGFISDLPTQLVAAFRATLEEVLEADLILHVRDASHGDSEAQRQDVLQVLSDLGIGSDDQRPVIEVLNKIDLLEKEDAVILQKACAIKCETALGTLDDPFPMAVSAITGEGLDQLYTLIDDILTRHYEVLTFDLPMEAGQAMAWLHAHGDVVEECRQNGAVHITVRMSAKSSGQFYKKFQSDLAASNAIHAG